MLTQVARALGLQGKFDEAIALLDSLPTADPELSARIWLERGRVLNSSGRPMDAIEPFSEALLLATASDFEHLMIDALHMLAIVSPPEMQDVLNGRALQLATHARDPRARQWRASLLNNMGWTAFDRGEYTAALGRFEDALEARIDQGKPAEIQIALWSVGRTLRALGRFDEALAIQESLAAEHRAAGASDAYVEEELAALKSAGPLTPE